jgi:hypothetical protein
MAIAFAAFAMLLVLGTTTYSTSALAYVPGVKAGDNADYRVVGNPTLPYNRTHIEVWGTKGSYVTLTASNYFPNGTLHSVVSHNWSIDSYGSFGGYLDAVFYWMVSANMSKGDNLLTDTAFGVIVQSNMTMTVAGASRFVLYANGSALAVGIFLMYVDRASGLVVKGDFDTMSGWINTTLISTNVWSAPVTTTPGGLSTMTLAAIGEGVVILVLIAFIALKMRGKK